MDDQKDNLTDISEAIGDIVVNSKKRNIGKYENMLSDMASREADISSIGVEKNAQAIKNSLSDDIFCKHYGTGISSDLKYCKRCSKEQ